MLPPFTPPAIGRRAASAFSPVIVVGHWTPGRCSIGLAMPIRVHRFRISLFLKYSRNHSKLLKFVEICIEFIKNQFKLCMNPLEQSYAINVTIQHFHVIALHTNSHKANLEVFSYKNP
jgi:hypothetical protein